MSLPYYKPENGGTLRSTLSQLRIYNRARAVEWRASRGRALDVGCGRGSLLQELAHRGWEVTGTDWNVENARAATKRLHIPVKGGANAICALPDSSYDVVSLLHVIEHDEKPLNLLKQANRVLKPGGRLLLAVPNARSSARLLFRRYWFGYDFPRHRCVFTPKSLRIALQRSGFSIDRLTGRLSDEALDVHGSIGLLLQVHGHSRPFAQLALSLVAFSLLIPSRLFGLSSVIYAYAKKS